MKINRDTIARIVVLVVVLINQVLTAFGLAPVQLTTDQTYQAASAVLTVAATVYVAWCNNSVTKPATDADKVLALMREGSVTIEQILSLANGTASGTDVNAGDTTTADAANTAETVQDAPTVANVISGE